MDLSKYDHKIFALETGDFESVTLEVFRFQYQYNHIYHKYVNALGIDPASVKTITQIPFLPIRFFKSHAVQTTEFDPEIIFESSGTTGSLNSQHRIRDLSLYENSFTRGFEFFYGQPGDYCIIGLLPSYLERNNSSLVYMVNRLIHLSGHPLSGFYLGEHDKLIAVLKELEQSGQKTILIGVTFALLDLAEAQPLPLKHTIIMETGGMKGRREEMVREEVHERLKKAFDVSAVQSEYGMTELLSQAYSKMDGVFQCPPWMRVLIRDDDDPLSVAGYQSSVVSSQWSVVSGQSPVTSQQVGVHDDQPLPAPGSSLPATGAINVIDLANIHSCCFIGTDDAGKLFVDGSFGVLGRIDNSDIRGCSLMTV